MDYLEKFNQTFLEFGEDIMKVFPDDDEFRMYNLTLNTVITMYPDYVLQVFTKKVIEPFGDKIMERDESFFLQHEYDDVKEKHQQASEIINKIKSYWEIMNASDREVVWKYFRVLVLLGKKIRT